MAIKNLSLDGFNYKEIKLLKDISEEEFEEVKKGIVLRSYGRGDRVFSSGHPSDKMYLILEGKIKISKYLTDGREQLLYIYTDDEFVGGHNILSNDPYEYNAETLVSSKLLIIRSKLVHKVLIKSQNFLLSVLSQSFERIRMAEDLIDRLSIISTDQRVAKLIESLGRDYGREDADGLLIPYNTTQEELASLAGISRETMSRKLNQFEEEGIIKIPTRGEILVIDREKLEALALR